MDTNPVSQTNTLPSAVSSSESTKSSKAVLTSDFEVFLQMLTAQARYQDPLDPIDSSEYSAQLAQFSMVEQQVLTNELMENLVSALSLTQGNNLGDWIGMEALAPVQMPFDGGPITVKPDIPRNATSAEIVAYDDSGAEVDRRAVPVTQDTLTWSGIRDDGTMLPQGLYTLKIEASENGAIISEQTIESYHKVIESRLDNGSVTLVLADGQKIRADNVVGLRDPNA